MALGGLHVTALPDEAARHADTVPAPAWPTIVAGLMKKLAHRLA